MTSQPTEARAFPFIRRSMRILRWAVIIVLTLLAALVVRLHMGPLSIDFLAPLIADRLTLGAEDVKLEFDDGSLAWGDSGALRNDWSFLDLRLQGLRLRDASGEVILTLPSAALAISGRALIAGRIAPAGLEVEGLQLRLRGQGDDLMALFAGSGDMGLEPGSPAALLLGLLAPQEEGEAAGYLQRVTISDATVHLEEGVTGSHWRLSDAALRFSRGRDDMRLAGSGNLSREGQALAPLDLAGVYNPIDRSSRLELQFEGFNPADMAGDSRALAALKAVDMPVAGAIGATIDADRAIRSVRFDLSGAGGAVVLPDIYPDPVRLDGGLLTGEFDVARRQATLDDFRITFAGATIEGDGLIYEDGGQREGEEADGGPGIRLFATLTDLSVQWLKVYWPPGMGDGARRWVVRNLTAGRVTEGEIRVDIRPEMWAAGALPAEAIELTFDYVDVTAHYLRPMPPIQGLKGRARLDAHRFEMWADSGAADGVSVAGSRISFQDIHKPALEGRALIEAKLKGSARDVLTLVDHDPLGYPAKFGLDPRAVEGATEVDLMLTFPPISALSFDDVTFKVRADVDPVRLPKLFTGVGITDGKVALDIDGRGLKGVGRIALNDVPFDLEWTEDFTGTSDLPSRYRLKGEIEGAEWEIFSLPLQAYVTGPGEIDLVLEGRGAALRRGEGTIDFEDAALGFEELGWAKPEGAPAVTRFRFEQGEEEQLSLPSVIYEDQNLRASGTMIVAKGAADAGGGLKQMVIDSLRVGETHLAATVTRNEATDYLIAVTAESFDARPFITKTLTGAGTEGDYAMPSFELDIMAVRVLGLNGVELGNLAVSARYLDDRWASADVLGTLTGGGSLSCSLAPVKGGDPTQRERQFRLASSDAGEVARALGLFENAVGGELAFTGVMTDPGDDQKVSGLVEIDKFRVVTAPTLAQILSAGSLGGIRDLLAGDGIGFTRLQAPYDFAGNVVTLRKARAWGPAIGLTMSGDVDIRENQARLEGTIVPAYTANSILGKIPVLGTLLVGGEGQGLFAINYRVAGSLDEPDVSVNPLSMLTPGFLRNIFGALDEGPDTKPAADPEPQKAPEPAPAP